jgi:four helix bundle protein
MKTENIIQNKTFDFALKIIKLSKTLKENNETILANQILRCGTSIGANIEEAIGGSSIRDFLSKCTIAYKEARETKYWLRLIDGSKPEINIKGLHADIDEITKILSSIILSTKMKLNKAKSAEPK